MIRKTTYLQLNEPFINITRFMDNGYKEYRICISYSGNVISLYV